MSAVGVVVVVPLLLLSSKLSLCYGNGAGAVAAIAAAEIVGIAIVNFASCELRIAFEARVAVAEIDVVVTTWCCCRFC